MTEPIRSLSILWKAREEEFQFWLTAISPGFLNNMHGQLSQGVQHIILIWGGEKKYSLLLAASLNPIHIGLSANVTCMRSLTLYLWITKSVCTAHYVYNMRLRFKAEVKRKITMLH